MTERIEVRLCGEYGCRVVKLSVDPEGKVRVLEECRVDSRQSDDVCYECGEPFEEGVCGCAKNRAADDLPVDYDEDAILICAGC